MVIVKKLDFQICALLSFSKSLIGSSKESCGNVSLTVEWLAKEHFVKEIANLSGPDKFSSNPNFHLSLNKHGVKF